MRQWIQGEATQLLRGGIAQAKTHIRMRKLVEAQRHHDHEHDDQEQRGLFKKEVEEHGEQYNKNLHDAGSRHTGEGRSNVENPGRLSDTHRAGSAAGACRKT